MRRNRLFVLVLALVVAGAAGFTTLRLAASRPVSEAAPTRKILLAVAARDLPVGALVSVEDVRLIEWPGGDVPAGYFNHPEDVIGRGLIRDMRTNEPFLATRLAEPGSGGGLPIVIPEGKRAMSISVDQVVGVAGFVIPGTRVDVLLTLEQDRSDPVTKTILQNITVLTAGQVSQRTDEGEPILENVVTLLLDPAQAERLSLATRRGRVQLSLRNMLDMEEVDTPGARTAGLLGAGTARRSGAAPARASATAARPSGVVEVYRGGTRSIQRF